MWPFSKASSEEIAPRVIEPIVTIPPALPGRARTLILCFDGTGDQVDKDNTNVVELRDMLKDSEDEQLVYYQQGIGTYTPKIPGIREPVRIPVLAGISQKYDEAVAWSLPGHVIEAYLWLVDNYRPGDKICMFGFSRGSYTARALAGMLFKVGLLPTAYRDKAQAAFESYEAAKTKKDWEDSRDFQKNNGSINVPIEFIGCWDTVSSVGLWTGKSLPFTASNPMVRNFRHAVSLDERRAKFRTNLWSANAQTLPGADGSGLSDIQKTISSFVQEKSKGLPPTNVEEVWFIGCHCDVGGGSVPNEIKPNLAHISLRWMIRECFVRNTGIMFSTKKLADFHLDPDSLYPVVKPRPPPTAPKINKIQPPTRLGPIDTAKSWLSYLNPFRASAPVAHTITPATNEEEADAIDALAPIYDMLDIKPQMWYGFEKVGLTTYDPKLGKRVKKVFNKLPRSLRGPFFVDPAKKMITKAVVKIHRTVLARMNAQHADGSFYVPKALLPETKKPISLDAELTAQPAFHWVD